MNFHTFTVAIVYFFSIVIIHIILKNNNYHLSKDYNNYEESEYETDYSDNELILDLDTLDNLKQETVERTKNDKIQNISQEDSDDIKHELLKYLDIEKLESEELKKEILKKKNGNNTYDELKKYQQSDFKSEKTDLSKHFKHKVNLNSDEDKVLAYDDLDTSYASFA